jgi:hypothetical protein
VHGQVIRGDKITKIGISKRMMLFYFLTQRTQKSSEQMIAAEFAKDLCVLGVFLLRALRLNGF